MLKTLKTFYQFLAQKKAKFVLFIFVLLIAAIVESISPYFYKQLIDNAANKDYVLLIKILVVIVGLRVASNLINVLSHYLSDWVVIPASRETKLAVFKKVQELDFAYHVNKSTGSLISAFKRGEGAFWSLDFAIHHHIFKTVVSLFVTLFFFSQVSFSILWIMVALFIINTFLSIPLVKLNLKRNRRFNKESDKLSGIVTDNLINYETVKFFAQEDREEKRIRRKYIPWTRKIWKLGNSFRLMDTVIGTTSGIGMFLVFWVVVKKLVADQITLGDFTMVSGFITGFYYRFFDLLYQFRQIGKHMVDLEKYFKILDEKTIVKDPKKPTTIVDFKSEIAFRDVSFNYPDRKENVLDKINIKIKPGETIAFVGKSGAGKTTIIKLLLRFYDPSKGNIFVSGTNLKKMTKKYLRSFIGVVPQEPILFSNTIKFNIGYAAPGVSKQKIVQAAKIANLHDFIMELPKKYKTQVGERGIKLSGGQKQRLAIARAILADPEIIVFDEATSNLDSESEKLVQDALWKIAKGKTVLIIAHRFSTIRKVDRIIVMENGKIVDQGTHSQLIREKEGVYYHLWQLQQKGKVEVDLDGLTKKPKK